MKIEYRESIWWCPKCGAKHDRPRGRSWATETKSSKCRCGYKVLITTTPRHVQRIETVIIGVEEVK